jgi:2-desacetyl-2-hydroxyethyl bacteriochlorophyllide A dehydrogenase
MRRALVVEEPGKLALVERDDLAPGHGEVLVRPAYCGVCGTDLELWRGEVDPEFVRYPLTLGHEWAGTIESVGEGVTGLGPGVCCVAEGILYCGACAACRSGATNVCQSYQEIGFTHEGAAGDQIIVPAGVVHTLGDDVPLVDAAVLEPSAVVFTGLEKARLQKGQRILVVGDGTIALLAVLLASLLQPAELHVAGRRPEQEELARSLGATAFTTGEPATGFDVAIEAAGAVEAMVTAITAVRRGGTVLLLGLAPAGSTLELPADLLLNNDLTIAASFGYTTASWARVTALLNEGRFRPGQIVTHRFPLADYEQAFEELAKTSGRRGKVMLEVAE